MNEHLIEAAEPRSAEPLKHAASTVNAVNNLLVSLGRFGQGAAAISAVADDIAASVVSACSGAVEGGLLGAVDAACRRGIEDARRFIDSEKAAVDSINATSKELYSRIEEAYARQRKAEEQRAAALDAVRLASAAVDRLRSMVPERAMKAFFEGLQLGDVLTLTETAIRLRMRPLMDACCSALMAHLGHMGARDAELRIRSALELQGKRRRVAGIGEEHWRTSEDEFSLPSFGQVCNARGIKDEHRTALQHAGPHVVDMEARRRALPPRLSHAGRALG